MPVVGSADLKRFEGRAERGAPAWPGDKEGLLLVMLRAWALAAAVVVDVSKKPWPWPVFLRCVCCFFLLVADAVLPEGTGEEDAIAGLRSSRGRMIMGRALGGLGGPELGD